VETGLEQIDDARCLAFTDAVEFAGKRWSASILMAIARGSSRFGQITESVPGLSDRMLAQRLRELELAQLVDREVVASTPVLVHYRLTSRGGDLLQSLQPLVTYTQRWAERTP
jgi:DNA-binding HxlR family transcriptional regulator